MNKSPAKQRLLATALAGASMLGVASSASAAGVSVIDINDVFGLFGTHSFDSSSNTLTFTAAVNPATNLPGLTAYSFQGTGNTVGALGISLDTLSVKFQAAPGYKITNVHYDEAGLFFRLGAGATTYIAGTAAVNGGAAQPLVGLPPTVDGSGTNASLWFSKPLDFAVNGSTATVAVGDVLVALSGASDLALIAQTIAKIKVDVAAVPLPPALWMLGSALVGLVTVGRRKVLS